MTFSSLLARSNELSNTTVPRQIIVYFYFNIMMVRFETRNLREEAS